MQLTRDPGPGQPGSEQGPGHGPCINTLRATGTPPPPKRQHLAERPSSAAESVTLSVPETRSPGGDPSGGHETVYLFERGLHMMSY